MTSFTSRFVRPFFTGSSSSGDVPGRLPVGIDGRAYLIDCAKYNRSSIPSERGDTDVSGEPDEQSLSRAGVWARQQSTWELGAGQEFFDAEGSSRKRFYSSKGIDNWSPERLTLHHATALRKATAGSNSRCLRVGSRFYQVDGTALYFTTDPSVAVPTWTTVTGTPGTTINRITTDGFRVWIATSSGCYKTDSGVSVAASFNAQACENVAYVNGHLLIAQDNIIYELDSTGATKTTIFTHFNSDFTWNTLASGPTRVYAGGDSGGRGEIYQIGLNDTTGALNTFATQACDLRTDETVYVMVSQASFMWVGTNLGIRLAQIDRSTGSLDLGPIIDEPGAVRAIEPVGKWIYFSWTNLDNVSTGIGRLNTQIFTSPLAPAFSSDLMAGVTGAAIQGNVLSIVRFGSKMYFTVASSGVYGEDATYVTSGTLDHGLIRFGVLEPKIAVNCSIKYEPLQGTIQLDLYDDDNSMTALGTADDQGTTEPASTFSGSQLRAESFRLVTTLTQQSTTEVPTLRRFTLRSRVIPERQEQIIVPVILKSKVDNRYGTQVPFDTLEHFQFFQGLLGSGRAFSYQEGTTSYLVQLKDYEVTSDKWNDDFSFFEAQVLLKLVTLGG